MTKALLSTFDVPGLFASYRIGDYPSAGLRCHPWRLTQTKGILLNAFDLLANRRTRKSVAEMRSGGGHLHEYVEFDGPLILDSGAFNFLRREELTISASEVLSIGIELGADVSVVLDHPFTPTTDSDEVERRWANTVRNTREMFRALEGVNPSLLSEGFRLIPVVHGHNEESLSKGIEDIREILGREPEILGIGSLAPLALNGSKRTVVEVITETRRLLPSTHLHCFSLGSALLMLLAFYCGADSVDSQTWMMSAAFKQVQLPGLHLTRFSRREAERNPERYGRDRGVFADHLVRLIGEESFCPKDWDTGEAWPIRDERDALAYIEYLEDGPGENHVHRRACHNLHVFNFEAGRVRREMSVGSLDSFVERRIEGTVYRRVWEYARERKVRKGTLGDCYSGIS